MWPKCRTLSVACLRLFLIVIDLLNIASSQDTTTEGNLNFTSAESWEVKLLREACAFNDSNPVDFRQTELRLFNYIGLTVPNENSSLSYLTKFKTVVNEFVTNANTSGDITLPPDYDPHHISVLSDRGGLDVYVTFLVYKVLEIDERNEAIVLDTEFSMRWEDERITDFIKKNNGTDPNTMQQYHTMIMNQEFLNRVWKPDLVFDEILPSDWDPRANDGKMMTVQFIVWSDRAAYIVVSRRKKIKLKCEMEFQYYPADTQTCVFYIRSYSYPDHQLELKWMYWYDQLKRSEGLFFDDPTDANFDLQLDSPYHEGSVLIKENFARRGTYSALQIELKLRRKLSYHLVQTYLPSVLLIFITWLCFLLPANMVEARIGISMTTLLTLTAMFATVREQSPKVSYTMAIDVWVVFCIFFVFLALLLFIVMYWMRQRLQRKRESLEKSLATGLEGEKEEDNFAKMENYRKVVMIAKRYGFWAFATNFVIFFILYWTWLLMASKYMEWDPNPKFNAVMNEYDYNGDIVQNGTSVYTHDASQTADDYNEKISRCRLRKLTAALEMMIKDKNGTFSSDLESV